MALWQTYEAQMTDTHGHSRGHHLQVPARTFQT